MDWTRIKALLAAYYDATTTEKEEQELREALSRPDCPPELQEEAALFASYAELAEEEIPSFTYELEPNVSPTKSRKKRRLWVPFGGVAAAIVAISVLYISTTNKTPCPTNQPILAVINNQVICDQDVAKQEAREALLYVAQTINQSTAKMNHQ